MLLLHLPKALKAIELPAAVHDYLDSEQGRTARVAYKCRNRKPWYAVPDVRVPDFFLSVMSGVAPTFVRNTAGATCTNALHAVHLRKGIDPVRLQRAWGSTFVGLSCELEGHALGGGMLKLDPREAARVVLPSAKALAESDESILLDAVQTLRRWRHYVPAHSPQQGHDAQRHHGATCNALHGCHAGAVIGFDALRRDGVGAD